MTENPTAEEFDAAFELSERSLAAYEPLIAADKAAEEALEDLECRASYAEKIEFDEGEWDEFQCACRLVAGHSGDHSESRDASTVPGTAYAKALARYEQASKARTAAARIWHDARDALATMECSYWTLESPGHPCCLRRGHGGEHYHPEVVHLIL